MSCHQPMHSAVLVLILAVAAQAADAEHDVVVYGGTSGGIVAAIQTARMGKSVVLIEPSSHLGGLTSGGLGATDIGNKAVIGGLAREFYRRVGAHYGQEASWVHEQRQDYDQRRRDPAETEYWTFEPHVAAAVYRQWLDEYQVPVLLGERLDLLAGVTRQGPRIVAISMESGRTFRGKVFIDATYEGDLMARAGVSYHVGREANAVYGETLNGVQVAQAVHHQFIREVDPFLRPGDPSSGLLPLIQAGLPGQDGDADHRVQAYNFRLCTTDVPENRRPWPKPMGYDPATYELLLRNFEAGDHRLPWNPIWMPNRKTDTNNNYAISTDYIGGSHDYPEADYAARERIIEEHRRYQMGLMYTLANHARVPAEIRQHFQRLGLAKDEFQDNDNWPHQLYVREARRMISEYVMTQHHCQGATLADDPIGMGAYNMDSHNCQRYVTPDGQVRNEGDVQVGVDPYPVSFRSIRPRKAECENLLVPVCLAASHIAYGSIRMEPVFMVLGQSAATASVQAIDDGVAVQDIDYAKLRERLLADGQVLAYDGPRHARVMGIDPVRLPGMVVDNSDAALTGEWVASTSVSGFVGRDYLHDGNVEKGLRSATFRLKAGEGADYELRIAYTPHPNRATNVPILVGFPDRKESGQEREMLLNQQQAPTRDAFQPLPERLHLAAGESVAVTISNDGTDGYVIVDAVQLLPAP